MQTLFGFDLSIGQKWIIAFAVILALLALLGLFARQIKGGRLRLKGQGGGRARLPRLGVVDTYELDRQRQLVLIRRDNVEHLIMIGGVTDVVVETNILRGASRAAQAPLDLAMPERPQALEPMLQPEAARSEPEPRRITPPLPEPVPQPRQPVPPPQPEAMPPRAAAEPRATEIAGAVAAVTAGAGVLAGVTRAPAAALPAPAFAREFSPAPIVSASEFDDMARQLEEALKRPHSTVRGPQSQPQMQSPAPVPAPASAPAPAPVQPQADLPKPAEPVPVAVQPPLAAHSEPLPPVAVPVAASVPAPPMPSPPAPPMMVGQPTSPPLDVEAELALALGIKPERLASKPPAVASPAPAAQPAPTIAPAASTPVTPEPEPVDEAEQDTGLFEAAERAPAPVPVPAAEPVSIPEASFVPEPMFEPAPAPEPQADPEDPPPPPEPKPAAIDPFSVDAIEAEFARLLGRDPNPKA